MIRVYNKLIRDKIPDDIRRNGESCVVGTVSGEKLELALRQKLREESIEVLGAANSYDTMGELADVLEVVRALAGVNGYTLQDIVNLADAKKIVKGGFDKGTFLVSTETK